MKQIYIYLSFALTVLLSACYSNYEPDQETPEGEMTTVTLDISSTSLDRTTRATGTPEDPAYDVEKIHTWWVVFVDKNNNVQKIVSRPTSLSTYVEEESLKVDIPTGTYTLYSFGNISQAELKTKTGLTFTEGSACPTVDGKTIELSNDWDKNTDIPMSGKQSVTVTGRANEVFSVEVVRMLAKLEFQFTNESTKQVTLNKLTLKQTQTDEIPVLPNYTYLETGWPADEFPSDYQGNILETVTPTYSESGYGYSLTGTSSDWEVEIRHFVSPTWYSRVLWALPTIDASDTYQVSFTVYSDKKINSFEVGFNNDNNSQIDRYYITKTTVPAGEDTKFTFTVKASDLSTYNKYLQMNIIDVGDKEKVHIKNLKMSKLSPVASSEYLRDYSTIFTPTQRTLAPYSGTGTATSVTDWFYMRESHADDNMSNRYLFNVNVSRDGGHPEDLLFALSPDLYSIYRNDHVIVPIIISDFMVDLNVNFYPPIGGYPAVITKISEDKFDCYFGTQGVFAIKPGVVNSASGYSVVYNDTSDDPYYTYTIESISDPDGIFNYTPYIEYPSGEIVGEMNTNEGVATIKVKVTVHRPSLGAGNKLVDQIYDRQINIIRQDP